MTKRALDSSRSRIHIMHKEVTSRAADPLIVIIENIQIIMLTADFLIA